MCMCLFVCWGGGGGGALGRIDSLHVGYVCPGQFGFLVPDYVQYSKSDQEGGMCSILAFLKCMVMVM